MLRLYKITRTRLVEKCLIDYIAVDSCNDIKLPFDIKDDTTVTIAFLGMVQVPLYGK